MDRDFQDGSEALAHYGVSGMKWGVWNDETAARYGGARGALKHRNLKRDLKRVGKSIIGDTPTNAATAIGAGLVTAAFTGNPMGFGLGVAGRFAAYTAYDLAANSAAVVRGKKTYQERFE